VPNCCVDCGNNIARLVICGAELFMGDANCTGHLDLGGSFNNLKEDGAESVKCLVNRCID